VSVVVTNILKGTPAKTTRVARGGSRGTLTFSPKGMLTRRGHLEGGGLNQEGGGIGGLQIKIGGGVAKRRHS